jgi:hypothetical protein
MHWVTPVHERAIRTIWRETMSLFLYFLGGVIMLNVLRALWHAHYPPPEYYDNDVYDVYEVDCDYDCGGDGGD